MSEPMTPYSYQCAFRGASSSPSGSSRMQSAIQTGRAAGATDPRNHQASTGRSNDCQEAQSFFTCARALLPSR